jgi:hypothetical protein
MGNNGPNKPAEELVPQHAGPATGALAFMKPVRAKKTDLKVDSYKTLFIDARFPLRSKVSFENFLTDLSS